MEIAKDKSRNGGGTDGGGLEQKKKGAERNRLKV